MKRKTYIVAGLCLWALVGNTAWAADEEKPKRVIKDDGTEEYLVLPKQADCFADALLNGMVYGRLRSHLFDWHWDQEVDGKQKNNDHVFGLGGSLIFKTAPFYGASATAGVYTSLNPINQLNMDKTDVKLMASAPKDVTSRNKVYNGGGFDGGWDMTALAQAYLEYAGFDTDVKLGRQIYEGFLLASNDTKMIPNTFEGLSVLNKTVPDTSISAAYFTRQKRRNHAEFHDVIAFKGPKDYEWEGNDDSGVHKGLTATRLDNNDIDTKLLVLGLTNKSIKDLKADLWYTGVPDLFWSGMIEANYQISFGDGWSLTPGVRYMQQFDDGAGKIGGAAISGKINPNPDGTVTPGKEMGYKDPGSVDGSMWAVRGVLKKGAGSLLLAYSDVADEADLITPWRGFPTGGYTRDIAQVNWEANTASWMVKYSYDFDKAKILWGFRAVIDYTNMDYDETKEVLGGFTKTDAHVIHLDMWQKVPWVPNLEAKVRLAQYSADNTTVHGTTLPYDPSYKEGRFELNYLF